MSGNMLWEVKPIYSYKSAKKQTENYCEEGNYILGLQLEDIKDISIYKNYYMNITFKEGVALYSIYKTEVDKETVPVTNKEFALEYRIYKTGNAFINLVDGINRIFENNPIEDLPYTGEW